MSLSKLLPSILQHQIKKKENCLVIPFEKGPPLVCKREDKVCLKLRAQPDDDNSQTYEFRTYIFRDGSPEQWLRHVKDINKVFAGQNITKGKDQFAMARRLLGGKTLLDFESITKDKKYTETVENCKLVLAGITEVIFPKKALQKQRRGMRRQLKKPSDMLTSTFYSRLVEMNEQLLEFPDAKPDSKLPEEELKEILEFSLPSMWRMQMTLARFDPQDHTFKEFLDHCKEIEGLEAEFGTLAPVGVQDPRPLRERFSRANRENRRRHNRKVVVVDEYEQTPKKRRRHPYSYKGRHSNFNRSSIDYKKPFVPNLKKTPGKSERTVTLTENQLNVMMQENSHKAASDAVSRALKTQKQVANRRQKARKPTTTQDLETQIDKLKLYRNPNNEEESVLSSSSSNTSGTSKSSS